MKRLFLSLLPLFLLAALVACGNDITTAPITTDLATTTTAPTVTQTAPITSLTTTSAVGTTLPVTTSAPATTPALTTVLPVTTAIATTTLPVTTVPVTTETPKITLVESGKTPYRVIAAESLCEDVMMKRVLDIFTAAFSVQESVDTDGVSESQYEFLIGSTNRKESQSENGKYVTEIKLTENKVVINGENPDLILEALQWFLDSFVKAGNVKVPVTLYESFVLDMTASDALDMTYADMAKEVYDSFNAKYFKNGYVKGHAYWDKAEMIETYIDAYEATGDEEMKDKMLSFAKTFLLLYQKNWKSNEFNDDIMWACIAYCRIGKLVGKEDYIEIAKTNFDLVWDRAYDEVLGGGLYWRIENTTKNSCVNCPGAIAACMIGELTGDDSYYEKAASLMQWEFDHMFEPDTGRVYDAYSVEGNINKWASTYNQGTFIGACTLLHQKTGEERYMTAAAKAAEYAMTRLVNDEGVLDNNEGANSGNDLPGFKGILVRWLYRYAKYTDDLDILAFLQHNADVAYQNRNDAGIIWTDWKKKTISQMLIDQAGGYATFGMSTAVALMYNCQPWWEISVDVGE